MLQLVSEFAIVYALENNLRFRPRTVRPTHPSSLYLCVLLGSKQNFRSPRLLDRELSIKLCLQGISGCCLSLWNASSSACSIVPAHLSCSLGLCPSSGLYLHCFRLRRLYLLEVICSLQVTLYLIGLHGNRVTNTQDVLLLLPLLFFPLPSFPLTLLDLRCRSIKLALQ